MPRIDLAAVPVRTGSGYPAPHDAGFEGRAQQKLGAAAGLTQFGANLVTLAPGAMSSLRHWHEREDEFLIVTEGTPTLVDDTGDTPLAPGDCCAFPAGEANGHHIVNRSQAPARFLVVGTTHPAEVATYPDIDMMVRRVDGAFVYTRKDGTPFAGEDAGT